MLTVVLKPMFHRGAEAIGIAAPAAREIDLAIRKLKGVKWSQTKRVWYLPLSRESHETILTGLKSLATVNETLLRAYLQKRKFVNATMVMKRNEETVRTKTIFKKPVAATITWQLSAENAKALGRFIEQLKLKAYSASTMKTYRNEFLQLLQLLKKKKVNDLTPDDLRRYFSTALKN